MPKFHDAEDFHSLRYRTALYIRDSCVLCVRHMSVSLHQSFEENPTTTPPLHPLGEKPPTPKKERERQNYVYISKTPLPPLNHFKIDYQRSIYQIMNSLRLKTAHPTKQSDVV